MGEDKKNIVELVREDKECQTIINEMLKQNLLIEGIFHPEAYIRDDKTIEDNWKTIKNHTTALHVGINRYNVFFIESVNNYLTSGDFFVSADTKSLIESWENEIKDLFPEKHKYIIDKSISIGQYLEYMNRKSQGF